ncbi:EF-hand calcium-binding domain-containing protein 12 [Cariama cristata]
MVDLFKRAGMDRRKITRADFIQVIKATKVPISDKDLEMVIIFLASSKRGNFISNEDLIECRKQWLEMMKGQSRETRTGVQVQFHKTTCTTVSSVASARDKAKEMKPGAPTKPETRLTLLEVPPGKDSWLELKEKCRLVRSGEAAVDDHCLPSTVEGDMGALVDQYHRDCFLSYLKSLKLLREHNSHLTELVLQKALLHPGDKIIKDGGNIRQIRQPGGSYTTACDPAPSPVSTSGSRTASRKQAKEAENRQFQRNKMQMKFAHVSKSNDNDFWPGHLLDEICLYLPEMEPGRTHALFRCVRSTKPILPQLVLGREGARPAEMLHSDGHVSSEIQQCKMWLCDVSQFTGSRPC